MRGPGPAEETDGIFDFTVLNADLLVLIRSTMVVKEPAFRSRCASHAPSVRRQGFGGEPAGTGASGPYPDLLAPSAGCRSSCGGAYRPRLPSRTRSSDRRRVPTRCSCSKWCAAMTTADDGLLSQHRHPHLRSGHEVERAGARQTDARRGSVSCGHRIRHRMRTRTPNDSCAPANTNASTA